MQIRINCRGLIVCICLLNAHMSPCISIFCSCPAANLGGTGKCTFSQRVSPLTLSLLPFVCHLWLGQKIADLPGLRRSNSSGVPLGLAVLEQNAIWTLIPILRHHPHLLFDITRVLRDQSRHIYIGWPNDNTSRDVRCATGHRAGYDVEFSN